MHERVADSFITGSCLVVRTLPGFLPIIDEAELTDVEDRWWLGLR